MQVQAEYLPQEAAAVSVVERWVNAAANHDLDTSEALLDDNVIVRPDPSSVPRYGPAAQCASYPFPRDNSIVRLEEIYAVGGPQDTVVMFKRIDYNGNARAGGRGGFGGFGGFPVAVAAMVRVSNGKITEWLDAPLSKGIGQIGLPNTAAAISRAETNMPEACKKYPVAGAVPAAAPTRPAGQTLTYGTAKTERFWSVEENQAAQAVRGWFAARQAGDALLLGAFVDQNVVFRSSPTAPFAKGRNDLLKAVCGIFGGRQRLTELYPIGSDFSTMVLTESVDSRGTRTASIFRVQQGLISEWVDVVVESKGPVPTANPNSAACQDVNTALAR